MRRRALKIIRYCILISLWIILLFLIYLIVNNPLFYIKFIYIEGSSEYFTDLKVLPKSQNILFLSQDKVAKQILKKNILLRSILIKKSYPDKLYIYVENKSPVAIFINNERKLYIDEEGVIIPEISEFSYQKFTQIVCYFDSDSLKVNDDVKYLLSIIAQIKTVNELFISIAQCEDNQEFTLRLNETLVRINNQKSVADVVTSLHFLFKQFRIEGQKPKVLDLRFSKPVIEPEEKTNN